MPGLNIKTARWILDAYLCHEVAKFEPPFMFGTSFKSVAPVDYFTNSKIHFFVFATTLRGFPAVASADTTS